MQKKTTTNKLLLILIVVVGFCGGYFYYSQFVTESSVVTSPFAGKRDDLTVFKDFKLNTTVLESSTYRMLQIFGELPVIPGSSGKQNPFAP
jgi:hypothetical protein